MLPVGVAAPFAGRLWVGKSNSVWCLAILACRGVGEVTLRKCRAVNSSEWSKCFLEPSSCVGEGLMYDFTYHRPKTIREALEILGRSESGRFLAGGQTLITSLKHRLASPSDLIDLADIPDLRGINRDGQGVSIAAMTSHAAVASSQLVRQTIPALATLAGHIGDRQVRNMGTMGGSIANHDPASDYPAALIALKAEVRMVDRSLPAEQFFTGSFETGLREDELIASVLFPLPRRAAYYRFSHPASHYVLVGVFIAELASGEIRVAVNGAGDMVFRLPELEAALANHGSGVDVDSLAIDSGILSSDIHAGAEYRAQLIRVAIKHAVAALG